MGVGDTEPTQVPSHGAPCLAHMTSHNMADNCTLQVSE